MIITSNFDPELLELLSSGLPDLATITLDRNGLVLNWNDGAYQFFDTDKSAAVGKPLDNLLGGVYTQAFFKEPQNEATFVINGSQKIKLFLKACKGNFLCLCYRSSAVLDTLSENIEDGFLMLDKQMRYSFVGRQVCAIMGKTIDELIGKYIWDVFPDVVGSPTYYAIESSVATGEPVVIEDHYEPLGIWHESRIYPGKQGLTIFISDVTKRKRTEQELNDIFASAPDIICVVGTDRFFKKINPAMCRILGFTEKEILSMPIDSLIYPDDVEISRERMKAFVDGGALELYFENRYVRKNGSIVHLGWTATKGQLRNVLYCLAKDISDRKILEDRLLKTGRLAGIGSWDMDVINGTITWSEIDRELHQAPLSFKPDKHNILRFYGAEERKMLRQAIRLAITRAEAFDIELEMTTYLGKRRWVRMIAETEQQNGRCVRVYGSFQDIDDKKRTELALLATLSEKDTILESIGDGFFSVDNNFIVTYWNTAAAKMLDKPKEQILGKHLWAEFPSAKERLSYNYYYKVLNEGKAAHFEDHYPIVNKWFGISAYPSTHGLSVYFKDITVRKENDLRLRQLNAELEMASRRYEQLFQLSPLPKWVFDTETLYFLDVNQAAVKHYGYSYEEFLTMTLKDIRPVETVDDLLKAASQRKVNSGLFQAGNFKHRKKDGTIIEVEIQSNALEYYGRPARIVSAMDVTEKIQHLTAIEDRNRKLQDISWMQSHVIRSPLSRIMGLVNLLENINTTPVEKEEIIGYIKTSANELDKVIRNIIDSADPSK
ncbi:PAS domain S-box protein [Mucilaginibacter myungsuensis]|uniref:histidine kinase n=1 Tax=Mucilaginibacter myungsuensis TaxID=649104 RepID=A0A929L1G9_9SPHI|nr:PAS domain S-box protein [Mucilaginibacter myungsuensis]MBE9664525.1 PAS domain S-box protein [Mucilaginibacter myungsuensis]MDN3601330.1 PAS domain S-box protein [Mucilaginibacter myungsuensis]